MKRRREERRVKKKKKNKKKLRLLGGDFLEDNREKRPMDVQTFGEVVHTFIGKMYGGVGFKLFCLHLVFLVLEKNEWEKRLWKRREEKEEREEKGENMAERKLRNRVLGYFFFLFQFSFFFFLFNIFFLIFLFFLFFFFFFPVSTKLTNEQQAFVGLFSLPLPFLLSLPPFSPPPHFPQTNSTKK